MGVDECRSCGDLLDGECFECEKCGYGMYGGREIICDGCSIMGTCDECNASMCVYCVKASKEQYSCCGMQLCGANGESEDAEEETCESEDAEEETCAEKHVTTTLQCGHQGCNFYEGDCRTCKKKKGTKKRKSAA